MAETQTDQTKPLDAGHTTSEHALTKWVGILAVVIAVLSTLGDVALQAAAVLPQGSTILRWVTFGSAVIGALTTIAYTISRTLVKLTAMKNGSPVVLNEPADANAVLTGDPPGPKPVA